ncbi:LMBR1-like membrane protein-domain-containing protein [Scheffersomyces amazonensis]|uniref:LMBR1-like membrane protein-domain-containing protein n=1 Tax=Scheffersomyces amazonensis TaxID=1078765 RepID=UPI00315DDD62
MWVIPLVCYTVTLIISIFGIQFHINLLRYPLYFSIPITLAVLIPLSIIFLLPIDYVQSNYISSSDTSVSPLNWLQDNVILILWKSNYWTTFLLTWLLLPQLQEFYKSGYFTFKAKMYDSFKQNLKFQLILLGISLLGIIYLILEVGLTPNHLKLMIIALAHIYSLILALWLMSHGLITIPRNKWIEGNVINNLNHHYIKLPKLIDSLEDVKIEFKEDILKVLILTENFTSINNPQDFQFRDWILQLNGSIPNDLRDLVKRQYFHETTNSNSITRDQLTLSFMKRLTASFNSNLRKFQAYESEFESLFIKLTHLEDILEAKTNNSKQLIFRVNNYRVLLSPRFNFLYWYYIRPISSRILSLFYFAMSFIILQSEFFHSTRLSLVNFIYQSLRFPVLQFTFTSIFFSYMLFASLNSLTQLKIFNMYHLVPHNSDPVSACFYTTYIARLTIPLSYNFLTLFLSRTSQFENWFGQSIHLTGLFNLMNNWLPRLLLIPVLLTAFNIYDKLKKKIGLGDIYDNWVLFDDDDSVNEHGNDLENSGSGSNINNKRKDLIIVEAKRIINREIQRREHVHNLRPFNLSATGSVDNINTINGNADLNYQSNLRTFHDSLINNSDSINNRIDQSLHGDDQEPFLFGNQDNQTPSPSLWGRFNGLFTGFRNTIGDRLTEQSSRVEYHDEPLDNFNYDEDADENLAL